MHHECKECKNHVYDNWFNGNPELHKCLRPKWRSFEGGMGCAKFEPKASVITSCITCVNNTEGNWIRGNQNYHRCLNLDVNGNCINYNKKPVQKPVEKPVPLICPLCGHSVTIHHNKPPEPTTYSYKIINVKGTWKVYTTENRGHSIAYMMARVGFKYILTRNRNKQYNTVFLDDDPPVKIVFSKQQFGYK